MLTWKLRKAKNLEFSVTFTRNIYHINGQCAAPVMKIFSTWEEDKSHRCIYEHSSTNTEYTNEDSSEMQEIHKFSFFLLNFILFGKKM